MTASHFHVSSLSRKFAIGTALFVLIAVPITVLAGYNVSPLFTRAAQGACFDLTGEGLVNSDDVNLLINQINSGSYSSAADLNSDGKVDSVDLSFLQSHLNEVCTPTVTFFADPGSIKAGESVILHWSVDHAQTVYIPGLGDVAKEGSAKVTPTTNAKYLLQASGPGGSITASTTVSLH